MTQLKTATAIALILAAMMLAACTTVTELSSSSGCFWATGGPVPGISSGESVVCRSGKDGASVAYRDDVREIIIMHEPAKVKASVP